MRNWPSGSAAGAAPGPDQSAEHLEIRRLDFEYVRAAGWAAPARYVTREVGRRKTVSVPLFTGRIARVDALLTRGLTGEAVRLVKAGRAYHR